MMRFVNDSNKMEKERNMEFSHIVLLTVEIALSMYGYYSMNSTLINSVVEAFYIIWIFNLLAASLFSIIANPLLFSIYRVGFRMIHLAAVVYIFCWYGYMAVSAYVLVFCIADFVYLVNGVSNEQMTFSGRWIVRTTKKWRLSFEETNVEYARFGALTSDEDEPLFRKDDMEIDNSSDYIIANDDDIIFPYPPLKFRNADIV
ncbi:hypothetical protein GCK72_025888 [Caenorhabditis remanei]|uniref:Uncharacterized protein n=1 Tax=Caenorhabditis remanei TaxID=31234 RepID=A0A6A5G3D9_CAERE|nr:hypothetical protein GCK72_025888 [Caenorhabditis remanei]KAF1749420.1 hypothetical protein GCK72_025888 [Caenorhabditis remanei]